MNIRSVVRKSSFSAYDNEQGGIYDRSMERRFYYDKRPYPRSSYDDFGEDEEYFSNEGLRSAVNVPEYRDNRPQTAPRIIPNRRFPPGADRERNWDSMRPMSQIPDRRPGFEPEDRPYWDQGDPYYQREDPVRAEWAERGYSRPQRGGNRPPFRGPRQYTGYNYQRDRSRSPEMEYRYVERQPSPPRVMPEHLRWLHDRWSKYDRNFFSQGDRRHGEGFRNIKGPSQKERDTYNQQMEEYRYERNRARGSGATGANREPLASTRTFVECKPEPRDLKSQLAVPYYKFRKGGEYHWNPGRMYTFKEFLMTQPEDIEDQEEAVQKYNEYKMQFRQQALAEFFKAHSEDEWFLEKYHPILKEKKEERRQRKIQKRLDVFMQMLVRGWMEVSLDLEDSRKVRKLMDAGIVFMEGGDEGDVAHLNDLDYVLEEKKEETYEADIKPEGGDDSDEETEKKPEQLGKAPGGGRTKEEQEVDEAEHYGPSGTELEVMQHAKDYSYYVQEKMKDAIDLSDLPDTIEPEVEKKTTFTGGVFVTQVINPRALEEMNLHKSSALLIRNVPPTVTRVELEEICSNAHGGYLRLYLTEPDPNNGYFRQAIVSFWSNANLRKVCWKIRGTRLRGVTLIIIEYREFKKRLQLIDGLAADKSVVLRDIQLCKSLIEYLDRRYQLWGQTDAPEAQPSLHKKDEKAFSSQKCAEVEVEAGEAAVCGLQEAWV